MYEDIEAVLDEHVRPLLRTHGGEMEIIEVEDGVVRFKLKGKCAGCPAATCRRCCWAGRLSQIPIC